MSKSLEILIYLNFNKNFYSFLKLHKSLINNITVSCYQLVFLLILCSPVGMVKTIGLFIHVHISFQVLLYLPYCNHNENNMIYIKKY